MIERLLKIGLVLIGFVILALSGRIVARRVLDAYFRRGTLAAPSFVSRSLKEVLQSIPEGVRVKIAREVHHNSLPRNMVVSQDPPAGTLIIRGKTIYLILSKGSDFKEVPNAQGLALRKARLAVRNAHLVVGRVCRIRNEMEAGHVLAQYPTSGKMSGRGERVDFLVSAGQDTETIRLPRLLGQPVREARALLTDLGLPLVNVIERPSADRAPGEIVDQKPIEGSMVEKLQPVVLTVSSLMDADGLNRKILNLTYEVPPGISEKLVEIVIMDEKGRQLVHSKRHLPGNTVRCKVEGRGAITVQYFLDNMFVKEEHY